MNQLGTIMVSEYRMAKWERGGMIQIRRDGGSEGPERGRGPAATQQLYLGLDSHEGRDLVHGSDAALGVYGDVHSSCYHQGSLPMTKLILKGPCQSRTPW